MPGTHTHTHTNRHTHWCDVKNDGAQTMLESVVYGIKRATSGGPKGVLSIAFSQKSNIRRSYKEELSIVFKEILGKCEWTNNNATDKSALLYLKQQ